MKKEVLVSITVVLIVLSYFGSVSADFSNDKTDKSSIYGEFVPGEVIVGFKNSIDVLESKGTISSLVESKNGVIEETDTKLNLAVVNVKPGTEISFIENIKHDPNVKYAEPNYLAYASVIPNDPKWNQQYGPQNIKCPDGWDESTGSSNVVIAIIDTGVDYTHEDLADDVVDGYDFVDINFNDYDNTQYRFRDSSSSPYYDDYKTSDDDPMDVVGHGTHCAGIAGAVTDNGVGIAGVSWNCKIMPVRAGFKAEVYLNGIWYEVGLFEYDDIRDAIEYAADNGADVISMSFGGPDSYMIKSACNYAWNKGCVLVAAAGNEGKAIVGYPARYDKVIAVGAIDNNNERCSWSNSGANLELVAPGESILSTTPDNSYKYFDGTSMAAPHVAGVAALAISRYSSYSNQQIRELLQDSADDLGLSGKDREYGYGRVDATLIGNGTPPPAEPRVIINMDYIEKIDEIDTLIDGWFVWEINGRLPEWYYEVSIKNLDDPSEKQIQRNYNTYGEWPWQWNHENHWDVQVDHEFGVYNWYRVGIEVKVNDHDLLDFDDAADVSGDNAEVIFTAIYDLSDNKLWHDNPSEEWEGPDNNGYYIINGEFDGNPGDDNDAKLRFKITDNYDPPQASATIQDTPNIVATGQELRFLGNVAGGASPFTYEWRFRGPMDPTINSNEQNPAFSYIANDIGKSYNPSLKVTDALGKSHKGYVGFIEVAEPIIEIIKPKPGHLYSPFTGSDGRRVLLFGSFVLYIGKDLDVRALVLGADKVKFIAKRFGNEVISNYSYSDNDFFDCNFGNMHTGIYTIVAEAYQGSNKVSTDKISKIFCI